MEERLWRIMTIGEYILQRESNPFVDDKIVNVIILKTDERFIPQAGFNPFDHLATIETDPEGFSSKSVYSKILTRYATTDDTDDPEKNEILPLKVWGVLTHARRDNVLDLYILTPKNEGTSV